MQIFIFDNLGKMQIFPPPTHLAYLIKKTTFPSVIDYKKEGPKTVIGKATERERKKKTVFSINLIMSHVPQITHTQNSSLPAKRNLNPGLAITGPPWNLPLISLLSQFLLPTYTISAFQSHQQNYVYLKMPYCSTSPCLSTCYFHYWNCQPLPPSLAPDELPRIQKESAHL